MRPTQGDLGMSQGLEGVRRAAKERKQEKFTALLHHLSIDLLRECFYNIKTECGGRRGSGDLENV